MLFQKFDLLIFLFSLLLCLSVSHRRSLLFARVSSLSVSARECGFLVRC